MEDERHIIYEEKTLEAEFYYKLYEIKYSRAPENPLKEMFAPTQKKPSWELLERGEQNGNSTAEER